MGGGQDTRTMEIRMKSPSCRLVFRFMWNCRQCTVRQSDNDDEDNEYDDRDVDGDDGDQYSVKTYWFLNFGARKLVIGNMKMESKVVQEKAKEEEDQLNSQIRPLLMAGTFLPVANKTLEPIRALY
ncbi:hypothetical protein Tco_1080318 [Tanacetum coccineum]|uniref:Uncharacterized protein n=1 Tax=Tanacetum coccineum TaxID=301880 RepID=A0ABQ5HUD0_9ASTR